MYSVRTSRLGLFGNAVKKYYNTPALRNKIQDSIINVPITTTRTHGRSYSSRRFPFTNVMKHRVSFSIAHVLQIGVIGSIIFYVFQRKSKESNQYHQENSHVDVRRFKDKTVVITGAAGDIGGSTASAFASEGAIVFLVDLPRTEDILKQKCEELQKYGAESVAYITADVTNAEDVEKIVKSVTERVGHIDVFFNNAGIQGTLKPIHEQNDGEFSNVLNVNAYGVFLGMKYAAKSMIDSGRGGVIVNTASLAGLLGPANMAAYAASKFAVVGMTKTAAKDLAIHKIRVCAIAPGILEGKMWSTQVRGNALCRKLNQGDNGEVTEDELRMQEARMIDGTPMKRLGKLSEVASVVTFLSSEDASYLTGTIIPIDGGRIQ